MNALQLKEDRELWFKSMWNCGACCSELTNYKTCEKHERMAESFGLKKGA